MGAVKQRGKVEESVSALVAHPVRARAFMVLAERTASPSEIAAIIGESLNDVAYHVRKLADMNAIEMVDTKPVRGAVQHFYRATNLPLVWAQEYDLLPQAQRNEFGRAVVQFLFADVSIALNSGVFSSRSNNCVARNPMLLDEEGWDEASAIMEKALKDVMEVQAHSNERRVVSKEEGIHVEAGLLLFEREMNG